MLIPWTFITTKDRSHIVVPTASSGTPTHDINENSIAVVQLLRGVRLFVTPWTIQHVSLSCPWLPPRVCSKSLSIELAMLSNWCYLSELWLLQWDFYLHSFFVLLSILLSMQFFLLFILLISGLVNLVSGLRCKRILNSFYPLTCSLHGLPDSTFTKNIKLHSLYFSQPTLLSSSGP